MESWLNRLNSQFGASLGDLRGLLVAITALCAPTHLAFAVYFSVLGLPGMALFNGVSAIAYTGLSLGLFHGKITMPLAVNFTVVEIIVHALLASLTIGWASGFHFYMIGAVALFMLDKHANCSGQAKIALLMVLGYGLLDFYLSDVAPLVIIDPGVLAVSHAVNVGTIMVVMGFLASVFTGIISRVDEEIVQLATSDALTGLWNRHQFTRLSEQFCLRQQSLSVPAGLLLVDIDHFKRFNDIHGHLVGDRVLRHVAAVMQSALRETDVAGRWGGEEFVILLPYTNTRDAWQVAERLRCAICDNPLLLDNTPLPVTITVGATELLAGETLDGVVNRADQALYAGKHNGRNRTVFQAAA